MFLIQNQFNISLIIHDTLIIKKGTYHSIFNIGMPNMCSLNLKEYDAYVPLRREMNSEEKLFASMVFGHLKCQINASGLTNTNQHVCECLVSLFAAW